ncbi:MAG TPA: 2-phospho-L-lactate guanylyltransferase [Streptosporangiaceae bacterium]|nr:2-phospho-L-lactate guanylyltransferase [Streptosporangiaceae bacterium]
MTDNALITWSVLMPVKVLSEAKSRLAGLAGPRRGELALAVACDTVTAVMRTDQAARAIVITDDPVAASALRALGAQVIPDEPRDGLNAALRHGAAVAAASWPASGTAALSADLPALRPAELARALKAAAAWPNAFVADAPGDGTTLYTAAPGVAFRPAFGLASRARHAAGGAAELELTDIPGLRRDVDTPADLRGAAELGLGPRTAPLATELLRCAPRGR